jgi:small subunit ribosomal protein S9
METKLKTSKVKKTVAEETVEEVTKEATKAKKIVAEEAVKESPSWENVEFTGEYIKTVGRRKTSVAQVRMYKDGKGAIMINGKKGSQYFVGEGLNIVTQSLKATGHVRDLNFSIIVKGGGVTGQIEACRHGISRALMILDPLLKEALKVNKFLTRDPRKKERKKPGFKGARKRPQWSKR